MSNFSPLGTQWLSWHNQRIFNFSEFLNLNGLNSFNGFSIWTSCKDCNLAANSWKNEIYLSTTFLPHFHYFLINKFFGAESLKFFGSIFDKSIIFLTGVILAEFLNLGLKNKSSNFYFSVKSILVFTFFTVNPWTYKMFLSSWVQIYFVFFFLSGVYLFFINKTYLGLIFFLFSGFFDYQSSAGLFFFYSVIIIYSLIKNNNSLLQYYFLNKKNNYLLNFKVLLMFAIPFVLFFLQRISISNKLQNYDGTSLLTRIGISGDDVHNGGIIGALQFLGGNRITHCLTDLNLNLKMIDLSKKILIFNCTLSILSMFVISVLSLIGLYLFCKYDRKLFNLTLLPLSFLLLAYTFILQQSSSVHLMGYSYFFSLLFAAGLSNLVTYIIKKFNYSFISICLSLPLIFGLVILCIRVNMMTGPNG